MHLIGKDILTTHAVYWPTMLMSLGIDLPKTIFAHGWWLMKDSKMSKSLGNVVNPMDLISDYGVDPVRYYLMREMVLGQDANFTIDSFIKRYNADLANDLGNLLSRVSNLIVKNFEGKTPDPGTFTSQESELIEKANQFETLISEKIDEMKIHDAIEETLQFVRSVNRYLEETAPWKLVKEDKKSAARVLYSAAETLRISAIILEPIMPNRMEDLLASLGTKNKTLIWGELEIGSTITKGAPLFPRIQV